MSRANEQIRSAAEKKGVKHWEIAARFGVNQATFCNWMRFEFTPEKKTAALKIIDEIAAERMEAQT